MSSEPPMSRRSFLRGRVVADFLTGVGETISDSLSHLSDESENDNGSESRSTGSVRYRKSFPVLRPPGAVEEEMFLDQCTRCGDCIKACPHDSITNAPDRFRRAAGTPMIEPVRQPCWMCEDTPCVTACEPGVLRRYLPVRMGTARVSPITCLAHQGSFCTVCSEQCPVEGAIEVTNGKPKINEEACTGCGVCQHVCPAPENAILLMPLAERPKPEDNASTTGESVSAKENDGLE